MFGGVLNTLLCSIKKLYKPFIMTCSWVISNSLSKFINVSLYPSHIVFKSNWILKSVLSVLSVWVLIRSANSSTSLSSTSLLFCKRKWHHFLKVRTLATPGDERTRSELPKWFFNLYTVPHFFFNGFHNFCNTRECNVYIVLRRFCKSIK